MQDRPQKPRKKAVNLSIDAELAAEAKAAGTNMSALLERALRAELKERRETQWLEENRAAIEASNRHFEQHGLPLAKFRTW
jgi:antitoxin CcdA